MHEACLAEFAGLDDPGTEEFTSQHVTTYQTMSYHTIFDHVIPGYVCRSIVDVVSYSMNYDALNNMGSRMDGPRLDSRSLSNICGSRHDIVLCTLHIVCRIPSL